MMRLWTAAKISLIAPFKYKTKIRKIAIHLLSNDVSKLKEYYEYLYPIENK